MNIKFTGRNVKITSPIKKKIEEMLSKHTSLIDPASTVDVELRQNSAHIGVEKDFALEITIFMPKVLVRVEEDGSDLYTIVDKIDPILRRRLKRFHENKEKFEQKESWKDMIKDNLDKEI